MDLLRSEPLRVESHEGAVASPFVFDHTTRELAGCLYDASGNAIALSQRFPGVRGERTRNVFPPAYTAPAAAQFLKGKSVYLGNYIAHYGHFLVETLSAFWGDHWRDADHLVMHTFSFGSPLKPFAREMLEALGIDCRKIVIIGRDKSYRFEHVTIPERGMRINDSGHAAMRSVYRAIRRYYGAEPGPRRLYLSRSRFEGRTSLENEAATEAQFADAGFEIVHPQELSMAEQIRLYAAARELAGPEGSALHNVVFCDPGAHVTVIASERHVGHTQAICNALAKATVKRVSSENLKLGRALQPSIPQA